MRYVYAVKASAFGDPFIAFEGFDEAVELVVSMNKGTDAESMRALIVRMPVFKGYEVLEGEADAY